MTNELSKNTAILATAADLVRCLVMEVARGDDVAVSDSVNGVKLTNDIINEIALNTFQKEVNNI